MDSIFVSSSICYIFVKKLYVMLASTTKTSQSTLKTSQTAFRFRPELLERLKNRARLEKKSLNSYVEEVLEKDLESTDRYEAIIRDLGKLKMPEKVSPEIEAISRFKIEFTEEEIAADERLAYLLSK